MPSNDIRHVFSKPPNICRPRVPVASCRALPDGRPETDSLLSGLLHSPIYSCVGYHITSFRRRWGTCRIYDRIACLRCTSHTCSCESGHEGRELVREHERLRHDSELLRQAFAGSHEPVIWYSKRQALMSVVHADAKQLRYPWETRSLESRAGISMTRRHESVKSGRGYTVECPRCCQDQSHYCPNGDLNPVLVAQFLKFDIINTEPVEQPIS